MQDGDQKPYVAEAEAGRFVVRNLAGRTVMVCRDQGSAVEYAVLLNEAYRQGYQAGYRRAKVLKAGISPRSTAGSDLREGD